MKKHRKTDATRRSIIFLGIAGLLVSAFTGHAAAGKLGELPGMDPIRSELVMSAIVTCSNPIPLGQSSYSKDGIRENAWPIVGGKFEGPGIKATVVPGGADFPLLRRDGMWVIDATYRLLTDDGVTIIIHNYGIGSELSEGRYKFRLTPEFWAPEGKYDWLNKSTFICTLTMPVPDSVALAKGKGQNDRLLQFYRIY
jgi:hypothetical protein